MRLADAYSYIHADSDGYGYGYGNGYVYSYSNGNACRNGNAYCYRGAEIYADPQAASHASATPIRSSA